MHDGIFNNGFIVKFAMSIRLAVAGQKLIVLNRSQSGLLRSTGSASPVFGRPPNAGLKSSRMVLTLLAAVGTTARQRWSKKDKRRQRSKLQVWLIKFVRSYNLR